MSDLLLIGGGGHCRAAIDVIEADGRFTVGGIVEKLGCKVEKILGYPVLGDDAALAELLQSIPIALIGLGQIKSPAARIHAFSVAREAGAEFPVIASPRAHVSRHAQLSDGTLVMHGAVVNAGATIGQNCIVNSQSLVEHDARIGDHCHISTGARVNGGVTLGEGCFIGSGAILKNGITIGAKSVIGAGCVILNDVPAGAFIKARGGRAG